MSENPSVQLLPLASRPPASAPPHPFTIPASLQTPTTIHRSVRLDPAAPRCSLLLNGCHYSPIHRVHPEPSLTGLLEGPGISSRGLPPSRCAITDTACTLPVQIAIPRNTFLGERSSNSLLEVLRISPVALACQSIKVSWQINIPRFLIEARQNGSILRAYLPVRDVGNRHLL